MNYTKMIDEAIDLFLELSKASTKKAKESALEDIKSNELALELLELLKDKAVQILDVVVPEGKEKNDGRTRLGHFLQFVKMAERMAEEEISGWVFNYAFRNADQDELAVYKAILTNAISLPTSKEQVKKSTKEEEKTQEEVESE
ncbi:TPA: hypothetical protein QCR36_003976 [Bacillus cereus]|nr:hypothetical protein [Bacillus cereus]HDR4742444.1 hypothetical protein [Bacillus cereus]HDR4748031.1 hypothetical protein [Bacillus cereus]HDR4753505.1 hypothetical protein [Bacillus cereus]HDR4770714.1 hypothetical protein [Bacillus cereus]